MDEQNPQVAGTGQPGYGPGPAPDPRFDGPRSDAEHELYRSALLTGTRAEYAAMTRQIMAARAAAAPAAPLPPLPRSPIEVLQRS